MRLSLTKSTPRKHLGDVNICICGHYHNTPDSDTEKLASFDRIQPLCTYLLLRWRRSEDVLHTGHLRRKEEDLIEGSSRPEATEEPANQLQTEREGHHTEADHLHCPHHWHLLHNKRMFKNQTCRVMQAFYNSICCIDLFYIIIHCISLCCSLFEDVTLGNHNGHLSPFSDILYAKTKNRTENIIRKTVNDDK